MILRTLLLAVCGCAAGLGTLHALAQAPAGAASDADRYAEMPLVAFPVVEEGALAGMGFVRLGLVIRPLGPPRDDVVATFLSDAVHDAMLGTASARSGAIDAKLLKASVPVRLARAGAPFVVQRVIVLQTDYRSRAQLRAMAEAP